MKKLKGKKLAILLCGALTAVMALQHLAVKDIYAANLVVTGNTQGITITPADEDLFFLENMLPGEKKASTVTIRNNDSFSFDISVEVTNKNPATEESPDLLDAVTITVLQDGAEITNFPAKGGTHPLGKIEPGEESKLDVELLIDGETGDEYQQTSMELQWIFHATSDYTSPTPAPTPTQGGGGGGPGGPGDPYYPPTPTPEPTLVPLPTPMVPLAPVIVPTIPPTPEIIPPEEVPLAVKEIPKTGETSLAYSIIIGGVLVFAGLLLLRSGKKNRHHS